VQQPSCFAGFVTSAELVDRVTVRRLMVCSCGEAVGRLDARQGWDGVPWADPLAFTCRGCSITREFFNSHRDGYDNVMQNGATSIQGEQILTVNCSNCASPDLLVTSDLLYNIDAQEIDEELEDFSGHFPSDCFDAFNVVAKCARCDASFDVGGWELA
jgi:hypothetical protein